MVVVVVVVVVLVEVAVVAVIVAVVAAFRAVVLAIAVKSPVEVFLNNSASDKFASYASACFPLACLTIATILIFSLSEDVLGAARQIEKVRQHEGSISEFEKQSSPPPHIHMPHYNHTSTSAPHGRPPMGPGVPPHPMYYHPQNMSTFYAQSNFGR